MNRCTPGVEIAHGFLPAGLSAGMKAPNVKGCTASLNSEGVWLITLNQAPPAGRLEIFTQDMSEAGPGQVTLHNIDETRWNITTNAADIDLTPPGSITLTPDDRNCAFSFRVIPD